MLLLKAAATPARAAATPAAAAQANHKIKPGRKIGRAPARGTPGFVLMPLGWFAQRANQTTTRYAGVSKKLYKKIPLSSTIRLFKS